MIRHVQERQTKVENNETKKADDAVVASAVDTEAPVEAVVTQGVEVEDSAVGKQKPKSKLEAKQPDNKKRPGVVVSGNDTDEVRLSACVYKNVFSKKSLTVHHLQRRLDELGYKDAGSDKDGWYGDLTMKSVLEFQRDSGLDGDGFMNAVTFAAVFDNDPHVTVVVD